MTRRPGGNPFVPGLMVGSDGTVRVEPTLQVPPWFLLELRPRVRSWVAEHQAAGATTKLDAAAPIVAHWELLASLERSGFADASVDGRVAGVTSPSAHGNHEIPTGEAAGMLGVSPQWIGVLVRRRELDARKVGRTWLVDRASLERYRERTA